jgi:hypothetical protein
LGNEFKNSNTMFKNDWSTFSRASLDFEGATEATDTPLVAAASSEELRNDCDKLSELPADEAAGAEDGDGAATGAATAGGFHCINTN